MSKKYVDKPEGITLSQLVFSNDLHEFWEIAYSQGTLFNIVPKSKFEVPTGGYYDAAHIAKVKGYKAWPHSTRVKMLSDALMRAEAAAIAAGTANRDDGGTCNFDTPMIQLPRWTPEEIRALHQHSGVQIGEPYTWRPWKGWRPIGTTRGGQGDLRTRMAKAAYNSLKADQLPEGVTVTMYYAMD